MVDRFVPEGDALEQQREVGPEPVPDDDAVATSALQYPETIPSEASDADVLEQHQPVTEDDEWRAGEDEQEDPREGSW